MLTYLWSMTDSMATFSSCPCPDMEGGLLSDGKGTWMRTSIEKAF